MDIQTREDVKSLVHHFYLLVRQDELLAPIFNAQIPTEVLWEQHLETMVNFWETVMFATPAYQGNSFEKHRNLTVSPSHFQRWLVLFEQAVNDNFRGPQAELIKKRADTMRVVFETKLFNGPAADIMRKSHESSTNPINRKDP